MGKSTYVCGTVVHPVASDQRPKPEATGGSSPFVGCCLGAVTGFEQIRRLAGPLYIGKTWYGKYDKKGEFTASDPNKLIARYFLDFNPEAVKEQKVKHWDGGDEDVLDPIPEIDN